LAKFSTKPNLDKVNSSEFVPPIIYKTTKNKGEYRYVISHIFRFKLILSVAIVLAVLSAILEGLVPIYIGEILTAIDNSSLTANSLLSKTVMILIADVGVGVFFILRSATIEIISQKMEADPRDELVSDLMGKSLTFHDQQTVGDLMSRAATDVKLMNLMINPGLVILSQAILGILVPLYFIWFINPDLTLIPFIFVILFFIYLYLFNSIYAPITYKQRTFAGVISGRLNEVITGIYVVRGMNQQEKERSIFYHNIADFKKTNIDQGKVLAKYWPLLFLGVANVLCLYHGLILLGNGQINIGQLVAYMILMQQLRRPTMRNLHGLSRITLGIQGAKRILQLINADSEIDMNLSGYSQPISGNVRFENVSFGYSNFKFNLKKISFSVESGQTIALVGTTGSGKTTITKLLTRLYDPQEGSISIDGVDLRDWNLSSLRSQTALVEQDVFLFSRTIKNNILFGMEASMDQVIEVAKQAKAHEFIMNFEKGYDTVIGERGITLSGGQRQRIAIARAILRNPKILILDDASSAIDSKTEDEIQLAIKSVLKGRVAFLITHRLAQIRRADKIILLHKGEIIGSGTHFELLKSNETYKSIFSAFNEYKSIYGAI
jgi:ATP-binding cassette subfamily B protein